MDNPVRQDAPDLGEWRHLRHELQQWQAAASDIAGCIHLFSPVLVAPELGPGGLLEHKAPFLLIFEELRRRGWLLDPAARRHHKPTDALAMTLHGARHRKTYYQALLLLPEWFASGLPMMSRSQRNAYYRVLLCSPDAGYRNAVNPKLSGKEYKSMLMELDAVGGDAADMGMRVPAGPGAAAAAPIDEVDDIGGAPPTRVVVPAVAEHDDTDSTASSNSSDGSSGESTVGGSARPYTWLDTWLGRPLRFGRFQEATKCDERLILICSEPGHFECKKHRNVGEGQRQVLGVREPLAFLGAWAQAAIRFPGTAAHIKFTPTMPRAAPWL